MIPRFLFFFLLLLAPLAAFCQNAKIDSLKRVIETTQVDTVKGRTLCRLCAVLDQGDQYDEGLAAGEQGLAISRKAGDRNAEGHCLYRLGNILLGQANYLRSLDCFQRSLDIETKIGNREGIANSLMGISSFYKSQGNYPQALDFSLRSLKINEEIGNRAGVATSLLGIGSIYRSQGDVPRALDYHQRSTNIYEEIGDQMGVANCLHNIGSIYRSQGDYPRALDCYQRSLNIKEALGIRDGVAASLNNIGVLYARQRDYARALTYFQQSLKIKGETGDRAGVANGCSNIGDVYIDLGQLDSARFYARKGLKLAQEVGNMVYKRSGAKSLYQVDSALGNWKSAFEAARLYHIYSDSLRNDEKSKELGRIESKAEYERQTEIERLKNEAEKKRERERFAWMLGSAGGGLLLLLIIAFTLFRGRKKEQRANAALRRLNEEIQQQKAEIEAQNSEITAQRDQLNTSNARLVELDRMKEQLTGMIVHDLKNPLNAVLGMASLPPDPNRLHVIRGAGQQMSQLVLNLLDVQKYEEAALVLKPQLAAAAHLIEQAAQQTHFLAEQKQIAFQIAADPRLAVQADAELIVRVLVNLLTNALKYAPVGDAIEIQATFDPQRGAVFRVTDHGKGIAPDQLERVFDRFAQADGGQASGQLRSTGLGLTFCRLTVEAHGGSIGVQSVVDRFTTFEFTLPEAVRFESEWVASAEAATLPVGPLPADLRAAHARVVAQLAAVPLYEVSSLLDLLEQLPDTPPALAAWKAALEGAALAGNEARYRELLG